MLTDKKNNHYIAMVVYSHYSRDARVRRYAEALANLNFSVDIICLNENYLPLNSHIRLIKYPLERLRSSAYWWYIFEYLAFFSFCLIVLSYLSLKNKYQLIHIHNMPDFLVFSTLLARFFGAKVILDIHDPMPELFISKFRVSENQVMIKLLKYIEYLSFKYADFLLTANPEFKKIFIKRHRQALIDKMQVILNCPDKKIIHPQNHANTNNNRHFNLLYMGTIDERFELHIPIQSLPYLITVIPHIRLIIIPKISYEGKYFRQLQKMIAFLNLRKYVKIYPPQTLEKLTDFINLADVGIVLAENSLFSQSIMPVKLLEFIQMGIPVIATKTSSLEKFFTPRDLYYLKLNNIETFAAAVIKLYNDENLRRDFRVNAQKYLINHNWQIEEKKYLRRVFSLVS